MPNISLISFRLAAVGLRSVAKNRSKWASCSGVTLDRLRLLLSPAASWLRDADRDRCGPDARSRSCAAPIDEASAVGVGLEGDDRDGCGDGYSMSASDSFSPESEGRLEDEDTWPTWECTCSGDSLDMVRLLPVKDACISVTKAH